MRSPVPFLLATATVLGAAAWLWDHARDSNGTDPHPDTFLPARSESDERGMQAEEVRTLAPESGDRFSRILTDEETPVDREALLPLFEAEPGASVTLPLGGGLAGTVTLAHRHPRGELALGVALDDFDDASAFFSLTAGGRIGGHLRSANSGTAWRIVTPEQDRSERLRRIPADELLCARYERGRLLPGMPPEPEASESAGANESPGEASAPLLESRPGSNRVIFLNFDGETVSGTPWNSSYNAGAPIEAAPFSNPSLIPEIWASIAEDYAIYEVNVTTDRNSFENAAPQNRIMAIFTPTKSWYGSAGGVAYVGSFGDPTNPYCWVFNVTLTGAAESGSHEIGHTLGLRHDGTSSRVYYTGHTHSSGVSWAPIMGTGYNRTIVQFSKGEYPNASRTENDLEIISGYLSFLPDDHGDSPVDASPLSPDGVFDLDGIVGGALDIDWFRFQSAAPGSFSATVSPPSQFRNLDAGIELLDENLELVATSAPEGPFDATIGIPDLPPGIYYLKVRGTGLGDLSNGYGTYGSVGTYHLGGTYIATPPPETPTGLGATDGSTTDGVALSWSAVVPSDGYRLYRGLLDDGSDATLLASPTGLAHLDDTATAGTVYHYFVTAVRLGRESAWSPGEPGWRQRLPPGSPGPVSASNDSPHSIRVSWSSAERAQSYRISRNATDSFTGSTEVATTSLLSWHDTSTTPGDPWFYFVEAVNSGGASAPGATPAAGVKIPLPPGTPTGLSASDGTSNLFTLLTWNAADGATGYRIYRHTIESSSGAVEIAQVGAVPTYQDDTGTAGEEYWYFVRAILPGSDSTPSNLDFGSRQILVPSPPGGLSASMGTQPDGVLLSWSPLPDADLYLVYRGVDGNPATAEFLGETTMLSWLDAEAAPGRTYRYFIRASNAAGTSGFSPAVLGYGQEADPLDDLYENNDDLAFATVLDSPEVEAIAVDGDPDWYEVILDPGDTRLDLVVPYDPARGAILVSLHESDGNPVASHTSAPGARILSHSGGAGLSYRILVERDEGAAVPYELRWRSLSSGESGLSPDVKLGRSLPASLGEGVFNGNGAGQRIALALRPGALRRVYGEVLNRSAVPGSFSVFGSGSRNPFRIDYDLLEGRDWSRVTAAMRRGGIVTDLPALNAASFRISVSHGNTQSKRRVRSLRCLSASPLMENAPVDAASLRLISRTARR